jgi:hypothetical protein
MREPDFGPIAAFCSVLQRYCSDKTAILKVREWMEGMGM